MIEIREDKHLRLYKLYKLLYGFYASVYEVKASDQKTHWNICHFAVALLMSPLYWTLKQVGWMLMLSLYGCLDLYLSIQYSEGSIKLFGISFVGNIKDAIDDSGTSSLFPNKTITCSWVIIGIGGLGYLCYQYPKLMLVSTVVLIGTILLVGVSDTINRVLAKAQQTINDYYAEVSKKASRTYRRACPCVKIVPATFSDD